VPETTPALSRKNATAARSLGSARPRQQYRSKGQRS
jgi:hypothetical protein